MRWLVLLGGAASFAAVVLLACSGSDSSGPAGEPADGSTGSPDDTGTGTAADTGPPDDRILPLALGRTWTFELSPLDGGTVTCPGTPKAEVLGPGDVHDGGTSLRYHALCDDPQAMTIDIVGTGDQLFAYLTRNGVALNGGAPYLYLDTPVADGHQWNYGPGTSMRWQDAGPVTVKAGSFTDCWRREQVTPPANGSYVVYCRGVGQVLFVDPAGNYRGELTAKSF